MLFELLERLNLEVRKHVLFCLQVRGFTDRYMHKIKAFISVSPSEQEVRDTEKINLVVEFSKLTMTCCNLIFNLNDV